MEQVAFTARTRSSFPRNLSRFVNGRNSLYTYFRDENIFVQTWKQNYRLFTRDQQHYFFAFILAITAMIRYIQIEFENQ